MILKTRTYLFWEHQEMFEPYKFNPRKPDERMIPKSNATKEVLQSYFRFQAEVEDEFIVLNKTSLVNKMVELFKETKCYEEKSEAERQEIIQYLLAHPELN